MTEKSKETPIKLCPMNKFNKCELHRCKWYDKFSGKCAVESIADDMYKLAEARKI